MANKSALCEDLTEAKNKQFENMIYDFKERESMALSDIQNLKLFPHALVDQQVPFANESGFMNPFCPEIHWTKH